MEESYNSSENSVNNNNLREAEYKEAFDLFAKNEKGEISLDELAEVLAEVGQKLSYSELQFLIDKGNVDEDTQTISYNTFLQLMSDSSSDSETITELIEAFKIFDTEEKGLINNLDIRQALIAYGKDNMAVGEIDKMIEEADDDRDGYINYQEFVLNLFDNRNYKA